MAMFVDLPAWLEEQCRQFRFTIGGVFQRESVRAVWPVTASDPSELEQRLAERGHLLPLPKEPAALANVLEVSVVDFLISKSCIPGLEVARGTERGYPDLEFGGPALAGSYHAVDIKAARRARGGVRTQSPITLYTGNTYFRWPDLHWPGTLRPFNDYATHLDVLMIYNFDPGTTSQVGDLELIVQESWRIASKQRSSSTREYIGAVSSIDALRRGEGAFATPAAFYEYWRKYPFRVSAQVQKQLQKALAKSQRELRHLRAVRDVVGDTVAPQLDG